MATTNTSSIDVTGRKVLYLNVKGEHFINIHAGIKTREYRLKKPYYIAKLEGKHYDCILFINGYSKNAPRVLIELKQIKEIQHQWKGTNVTQPTYELSLGAILGLEHYPK